MQLLLWRLGQLQRFNTHRRQVRHHHDLRDHLQSRKLPQAAQLLQVTIKSWRKSLSQRKVLLLWSVWKRVGLLQAARVWQNLRFRGFKENHGRCTAWNFANKVQKVRTKYLPVARIIFSSFAPFEHSKLCNTKSSPKVFLFRAPLAVSFLPASQKFSHRKHRNERKIFTRFSLIKILLSRWKKIVQHWNSRKVSIERESQLVSKSLWRRKSWKVEESCWENLLWKFSANIDLCQQCWIKGKVS